MADKHWIEQAAGGSLVEWVFTTLQHARCASGLPAGPALAEAEVILADNEVESLTDQVTTPQAGSIILETIKRSHQFICVTPDVLSRLSEAKQLEYVACGGIRCPYCGSAHLESDNLDGDGPMATANVTCQDCKQEWIDVYTLNMIEIADEQTA